MKSSLFKWRGSAAVLLLGVVLVGVFGGRVLDRALTKVEVFDYPVWLATGELLQVGVVQRTHGFFISGGHGWSIGSTRDEYEVNFAHDARAMRWRGPGVPFILQSKDGAFYLATYDRETDRRQSDFRCYVWKDGAWEDLPVKLFPRGLALVNLVSMGSDSEASVMEPIFRMSLLARFWFCMDSGLPCWQVNEERVTEEFVRRFAPTVKKTLFAP